MTNLLRVSVSLILLGLLVLGSIVFIGCASTAVKVRVPDEGALRMGWPEHVTARIQ